MQSELSFFDAFVSVFIEMAPYLFFGLFVAGALHVFIKRSFILSHFGGHGKGAIVKASLLGVPLPLCSCSVVPTALSFKKSGASDGATVSFLISTPQTGVESIAATWGMMGPLFAIYRPLVAFITGIIGGVVTSQTRQKDLDVAEAPQDTKEEVKRTLIEKIQELFRYGFVELMDDLALNLLIGLVVSAVIATVVPESFFDLIRGNLFREMVFVILLGAPWYICSTASIPVAAALVMQGISPAAAFVFLVVGPATNAATFTVIFAQMGRRIGMIYLWTIILVAIPFGFLLDYFYTLFNVDLMQSMDHMHHVEEIDLWKIVAGIGFLLLVLHSLWRVYAKGFLRRLTAGKVSEGTNETDFEVEGMTCKNCVRHVKEAIEGIKGVEKVEVDLESKQAKVWGDVPDIAVLDVVKKAGYSPIKSTQ